ncbi:MAG: hypothetical protein PF590_05565, partial [Candidatus Delongbacteria bacterium]|nr:hypothetical protein [Candidatus Delongbacteria bacterium]
TEVLILSRSENLNIKPTAGNYTTTAFIKKDDNAFDHISNTINALLQNMNWTNATSKAKEQLTFLPLLW